MKTARIGELVESVKTWNPSRDPDSEFDYIDLSAVDNASKSVTAATPTTGSKAPSRARQLVAEGDVLVSTVRPNLNAVAVVPPELDGATASTGFTVLRPGAEIDGPFLFHWVRSPQFIGDMVRKATGASYPAVSDRVVKDSTIPAPSLPEQRRIAAILDHADALRAKRRQVVTQLNGLTQAIFHRMFTGRGFPATALGELVDVRSSLVKPDPATMGDLPHVGPDSLTTGGGSISGWRTVAEDGVTSGKYRFEDGDVLYSKIRPNLNKVATASFAGLCSADMYALVPKASVCTAHYVEHLLRAPAFLGYADRLSNRANIPKLNRQQLDSFMAPLPPIAIQEDFARRIDGVRGTRQIVEVAQSVDDEMFASLQSRAFRGEL